jgi:hypothetical protein
VLREGGGCVNAIGIVGVRWEVRGRRGSSARGIDLRRAARAQV